MEKLEQKLSQYMGLITLGILSSLLLATLVVYNAMVGIVAPVVLIFGIAIGAFVTLTIQGVLKLITKLEKNSRKTRPKKVKSKSQVKAKNKREEYEEDYEEDEEFEEYEEDEEFEEFEEYDDDKMDFSFDDEEDLPPPRKKNQPQKNKKR